MWRGNFRAVRFIVETEKSRSPRSFNAAHLAAVSADAELPPKMTERAVGGRSSVAHSLSSVHIAAINPNPDRLKQLLALDPSALSQVDGLQRQPLHFAAACSTPGPLKLLLARDADRRARDKLKRDPAMFAARAGRVENLRLLLGLAGTVAEEEASGNVRRRYNCHGFAKELKFILQTDLGHADSRLAADASAALSTWRLAVTINYRVLCSVIKSFSLN